MSLAFSCFKCSSEFNTALCGCGCFSGDTQQEFASLMTHAWAKLDSKDCESTARPLREVCMSPAAELHVLDSVGNQVLAGQVDES